MNRRIIFGLLSLPIVFSTMSLPQAQAIPPPKRVELLDGVKWVCSTDGGKTFSPDPVTIKAETTVTVTARTEFEAADTKGLVVLELTHGLPPWKKPKFTLNGSEIKGPMKGMYYKTIPAIDAKLLKKGKNVLTAGITLKNKSTKRRKAKDYQLKIAMRLVALRTSHLQIQTGPILGAVGKDYFTITCRTNMPAVAEVSQSLPMCSNKKITMCKIVATSGLGLLHRFRIEKDNFIPNHEYGLSVQNWDISTLSRSFRSPQLADQGLRFVAMGDSRTFPKDWAKVADAVLNAKPDLVAFSGDMVGDGRNDWEWDEHYFGPARKFFATIPCYAVIGNHERNAPVYNELFYTPSKDGKNRNWSQTINGVLLIGIDGEQDFSAGSDNGKWLEKTLAGSKAKFIFLFNHYPAWSSSNHGRLDKKTGRPREKTVRQAQDVLVPLLSKYKATAYICGHDHIYERSELPGGLTHIISGGAGAPLRKKTQNAEKQNPHSKVFHSVLHYCLFEIKGDTCTMKAVTPDGKTIDTRIWKAVAGRV